ncbi:MAG: flagellar export protein FliJ [Spirochaetes bacterium GWD1_27_9]|nr:MAG: flagellar export protein FliJ [Spirochaetes bacterium GWB1_27_13]OHD31132.1 MAG: flagellar export protein FliJ [Spirochaetes bacterium GWD1_27_9]
MKKFSFKLEKLLKIKEHKEILAEEAYAKVLQEKVNFEMENRNMEDAIFSNLETNFNSFKDGDTIDFHNISMYERYLTALELKIEDNEIKKQELEPKLQKLKENLIQATKEKKTMEKLKEKELSNYKNEKKKHENKIMDEVANTMQIRKLGRDK